MLLFSRQELENTKYQELVKLAKQHDVYRRYAPKAELIEKLLNVDDGKVETLDDISMPSIMTDDGEEVEMPVIDIKKDRQETVMTPPQQASKDNSRPSTPGKLRRSLAGHAMNPVRTSSMATSPFIFRGKDAGDKILKEITISSPVVSRLTRQRTFDVVTPDSGKGITGQRSSVRPSLTRQATYNLKEEKQSKGKVKKSNPTPGKLTRQGTFELKSSQLKKSGLPTPQPSRASVRVSEVKNRPLINEFRKLTTASPKTPLVKRTSSAASELKSEKSAPRSFITSRLKNATTVSAKTPASKIPTKQKVNSVVKEIKSKVSSVSIIKESGGTKQNARPRKAPDFEAIHSKLFGKMESLLDSRQKIIERANSIQKNVPKCAALAPSQTFNKGPVVRKLISPKIGKSRIRSPKPILKPISALASKASISGNKRQSINKMITGISRLSSPQVAIPPAFASKFSQASGASSNRFGFNPVAPTRRDILKEVVNRKGPIKRISPAQRSRQMLQTVRLNKRFELQMKHRMNQLNA